MVEAHGVCFFTKESYALPLAEPTPSGSLHGSRKQKVPYQSSWWWLKRRCKIVGKNKKMRNVSYKHAAQDYTASGDRRHEARYHFLFDRNLTRFRYGRPNKTEVHLAAPTTASQASGAQIPWWFFSHLLHVDDFLFEILLRVFCRYYVPESLDEILRYRPALGPLDRGSGTETSKPQSCRTTLS